MANIKIPEKQFIINLDEQCRLLEEDGTAYADGDVTPSAGSFILENFTPLIAGSALQVVTGSTTRIISEAAQAAVAEQGAWVFSGNAVAGDVVRVVVNSPNLVPTEYQNIPLEKRYQFSVNETGAAASLDHLADTINADPNAHVTAYKGFNNTSPAQDDSDTLVLIPKVAGNSVDLYVGQVDSTSTLAVAKVAAGTTVYHTAEDTSITTAAPVPPLHNYTYLKNIDWAKNLDFDRNVEMYPQYGADYQSYYFEVNWTAKDIGGHVTPSEVPASGRTAFRIWVNTAGASTLKTAMDLLVGDVNV